MNECAFEQTMMKLMRDWQMMRESFVRPGNTPPLRNGAPTKPNDNKLNSSSR